MFDSVKFNENYGEKAEGGNASHKILQFGEIIFPSNFISKCHYPLGFLQ